MPASRAAVMTARPWSRLIRSYVRRDPRASLPTRMPLRPKTVRGTTGTEGTLTPTA
jgi:hypothetical protein